jgi:hypothetical protein
MTNFEPKPEHKFTFGLAQRPIFRKGVKVDFSDDGRTASERLRPSRFVAMCQKASHNAR